MITEIPCIKHNLQDLKENISEAIDGFDGESVFICCASYEKRSLSIASTLEDDIISKFAKSYMTYYADYMQHSEKNIHDLSTILNKSKLEKIELNNSNPVQTCDRLVRLFDKCNSNKNQFIVDITTFTHESLLFLLKLLMSHCDFDVLNRVILLYSTASEYAINDVLETKWLSKGIADVRNVLGFPGELMPLKKNHLIVLVGYEHERASALIRQLEPDCLSLGCGKRESSINSEQHRVNEYFTELLTYSSGVYGNTHGFEFSCNNPYETSLVLSRQIEMFDDYNVIIAPMNTKLSTIGVALTAIKRPKIQVCYAQPEYYNFEKYSEPGDEYYHMCLLSK